jgi:hypothetical protein
MNMLKKLIQVPSGIFKNKDSPNIRKNLQWEVHEYVDWSLE